MAPAPMKRTWCAQVEVAMSAAGPATGCRLVSSGTATPQEKTSPTSMAMPTCSPTRWPAPSRAKESDRFSPVAPRPMRK